MSQAFYTISEIQPEARIGYCLHYRLFDPARTLWPPDIAAASLQEESFNWALLRAAETGRFSFPAECSGEATGPRGGDA